MKTYTRKNIKFKRAQDSDWYDRLILAYNTTNSYRLKKSLIQQIKEIEAKFGTHKKIDVQDKWIDECRFKPLPKTPYQINDKNKSNYRDTKVNDRIDKWAKEIRQG